MTLPFLLAGSIAAAAAAGQLLDRPLPDPPQIGAWDIRPYIGGCHARLARADGSEFGVSRHLGRNESAIGAQSPAWTDIESAKRYRLALRFHPGAGSVSGRSIGRRPGPPGESLGSLDLHRSGAALLRRLGAAAEVEILVDGRSRGRFAIPGAAEAMAELERCAGRAHRAGYDMPMGIATFFRADDYPVRALANREQGTVGFRLVIDAEGRVAECLVTAPSGSALLDETTCRILRERVRYRPAAAADEPAATDDGSVTWLLPR